jgi:hypothetical protein
MLKLYLDKQSIIKFIGIQNILLTIVLNLTNIEYAKWFHLIKLSLVILYRNIYYINKGKPYYLIELCYILMFVNWFYLFCDRILLDKNEIYFRNLLYNNSFIYSSVILSLASFLTRDIITFNKLIANTRLTMHFDNAFLFFMLQKYNLDNNIDTQMNNYNIIGAITFYYIWLTIYSKLTYKNLYLSENPDYENQCTKFTNGNVFIYSVYHSILSITCLIVGYYSYFNVWLHQLITEISYIGITYFTAINTKY